MAFDGYGRLQSRHVPEQQVDLNNSASTDHTTYSYNNDDTVYSVTDARGASASYIYNNGRHLVNEIHYNAPTGITPTANVTFGYDAAGNRTSMSDGSGSCSYSYDPLSRMTSETRNINGLAGSYTIGYTYNLSGELKSLTDPQGRTVSYDFDNAGRLINVSGAGYNTSQFASNFQYRAWGAVKHYSIGFNDYATGGIPIVDFGTADLSYDARLRLTHFQLSNPTNSNNWYPNVFKSDYQYYSDGRVKFIDDKLTTTNPSFPNDPPQEAAHNFDRAYNYDHAGRLVDALTVTLTKPEHRTSHYDPPEWTGLWLFHNGRFSTTSMKQKRSWDPFPQNQQDLGYTSSAGSYTLDGTRLIMKREMSLTPAAVGSSIFVEYKVEGDILTLIDTLHPRPEDLSEGQQVIVLRKIK